MPCEGADRGIDVSVEISSGDAPGLTGRVTELHGAYYSAHWGFGSDFEARVAADFAAFLQRYDPGRDGLWTARLDGTVHGCIAVDALNVDVEGAHLRWFIVSERLRGSGIGARLLTAAIMHCRTRDFPRIFLFTFAGLAAARHLYEKNGFVLVQQRTGSEWCGGVDEQRFELELR